MPRLLPPQPHRVKPARSVSVAVAESELAPRPPALLQVRLLRPELAGHRHKKLLLKIDEVADVDREDSAINFRSPEIRTLPLEERRQPKPPPERV